MSYELPMAAKRPKQRRKGVPAAQTDQATIEEYVRHAHLVVVNSSGGKDSQTALQEAYRTCSRLGVGRDRMVVAHADLGEAEWGGTRELAELQAGFYGLAFEVEQYRSKAGRLKTLLEHIVERGMWPDSVNRYCTSDFKRGPITRLFTRHTLAHYGRRVAKIPPNRERFRVVNVFGMRAEESDARKLLPNWAVNTTSTNSIREVYNWLPIFNLTKEEVWGRISASGVPYHRAYDLGMPRLSCCFCIFSPREALILAGRYNRDLLVKYVEAEKKMGHTFRVNLKLADVLAAVDAGEQVAKVADWEM